MDYNGINQEEKKLSRASMEVAAKRSQLPWVRVEKDYVFADREGKNVGLGDMFDPEISELVVFHLMFDPEWDKGLA